MTTGPRRAVRKAEAEVSKRVLESVSEAFQPCRAEQVGVDPLLPSRTGKIPLDVVNVPKALLDSPKGSQVVERDGPDALKASTKLLVVGVLVGLGLKGHEFRRNQDAPRPVCGGKAPKLLSALRSALAPYGDADLLLLP